MRKLPSGPIAMMNRLGDMAILTLASFIAAYDQGDLHYKVALVMALAANVIWFAGSALLRQYDVFNGRGFLNDLALTMFLLVGVAVAMGLLREVSPRYAMTTEFSRFVVVLLPAALWLRFRVVGARLLGAQPIDQVLIVGTGPLGRLTRRTILEQAGRREIIGYLRFDGEEEHPRLNAPVLGRAHDLDHVLRERIVDEVYFATTRHHPRATVQAGISVCERFGIPFAIPACDYRLVRAKPAESKAIADGYVHYLNVRYGRVQSVLKRMLDIVVSATALLLLSPLMIAVALAVRLTSPGPILFRQERVGLHGRTFAMLKFRSMVANAEALRAKLQAANEQQGPVFKIGRDPRITPIGRFIRKHSIDELPQLINVLRGDMSLVGPRPPLATEVAKYEAWQRRRLSVRPGMTCVWQVSGRSEIPFEQWMLLDMRYIDHWSLFQDLRLLLRTVPVVLTGRGAS